MSSDPPYLRIVAELRGRVAAGELRPGDRVPSTRRITREWGVAMATATKVLATLRQEGLVRAVPGVGTVVAEVSAAPAPADIVPPAPRDTPTSERRDSATRGVVRSGVAAKDVAVPRPDPDADEPEVGVSPAGSRRARDHDTPLSRDLIVRAAVEVADTEGSAALSMRRVAAEVNAATMSLYRYVPGKDELLLAMMDSVFTEAPFPDVAPPGWRAQLEFAARLQWGLYRRHPWLAQALSFTRPQVLPNALAHTEWALRALDGSGLDVSTMLYAAITLFNYVRGVAVNLASEAEAEAESGLSPDEYMDSQEQAMEVLLDTGRFPTFSRLLRDVGFDFDLETLFSFGLTRILDGFEAFLPD